MPHCISISSGPQLCSLAPTQLSVRMSQECHHPSVCLDLFWKELVGVSSKSLVLIRVLEMLKFWLLGELHNSSFPTLIILTQSCTNSHKGLKSTLFTLSSCHLTNTEMVQAGSDIRSSTSFIHGIIYVTSVSRLEDLE